jgi:AcrR family transcriptional regulator
MSNKPSTENIVLSPRQVRADRILDVAADLMLRFGYKRVTVDDVAAKAEVGKGTVYQHWKTREELFTAVLMREFAAAIDEVVGTIRSDPQSALLQRLISNFFIIIMRRPLLRAVYTADLDTLGKLTKSDISDVLDAQEKILIGSYLQLLEEYGLAPAGMTVDELVYTFFSVLAGFFTIETMRHDHLQISLERKAELVGMSLQRVFETHTSLSAEVIQVLANRTIDTMSEYAEVYRAQVRKGYE